LAAVKGQADQVSSVLVELHHQYAERQTIIARIVDRILELAFKKLDSKPLTLEMCLWIDRREKPAAGSLSKKTF